jgi:hypothetical protein
VVQTWVKTARVQEDFEALVAAFHEASETTPIRARKRVKAPVRFLEKEHLAVIPFGDPHFGLLAWGQEVGEDFDLGIAREVTLDATKRLVDLAPNANWCIISSLGDSLHADGYGATTTKGTRVDVDSRWPKMLRAFIQAMIDCTDLALMKFGKVVLDMTRGNHDDQSTIVLAMCLAEHYRNEPRVRVITNPSKFHFHKFGKNLLGFTHGDTVKPKDLPGVMSTDQAAWWGQTKYRYWYTGHVHHQRVFEFPGVVVESFRTLAAKDAWHHGQGYRSLRGAVLDVWHKERGKILRHEVTL